MTSIGIIGVGRLGGRLVERLSTLPIGGPKFSILAWSRSGKRLVGELELRPHWVRSLSEMLLCDSILVAVSAEAYGAVLSQTPELAGFSGTVLSAAMDLSYDQLSEMHPGAPVARIAPFLIPGDEAIPSLVFTEQEIPDQAQELVESLGSVDWISSERAFEHLALLGSPLPTVVHSAVKKLVGDWLSQFGLDEAGSSIGLKLIARALASDFACDLEQPDQDPRGYIATPGGLTEAGLKKIDPLVDDLRTVLDTMSEKLPSADT